MEFLAWLKAHQTDLKELWLPLITACISLLSISIAFLTLVFGRRDRREAAASRANERQADADARMAEARRREQESLVNALQGEKESVGFMALGIARQPSLLTNENRERLFSALCAAWVFESSSRARAFILKALTECYKGPHRGFISELLSQMRSDFLAYDERLHRKDNKIELADRIQSLDALILTLNESAQHAAASDRQ
jgi:hypothetical protein